MIGVTLYDRNNTVSLGLNRIGITRVVIWLNDICPKQLLCLSTIMAKLICIWFDASVRTIKVWFSRISRLKVTYMFMALINSLVVLFIAVLLQIFWGNFYSNASCFLLLWLYLGNSQVSVYRTIGPTLVLIILIWVCFKRIKVWWILSCACVFFGVVVLFSFTSLSRLFHSYRGFDPHSGRHVVYLFRLPLNAKLLKLGFTS